MWEAVCDKTERGGEGKGRRGENRESGKNEWKRVNRDLWNIYRRRETDVKK